MASWLQITLVVGLICCSQTIRDNSFKFRVPAGWYECFHEEFDSNKDERMELFYEVVKGGGLDIKISVSGPDDRPIVPASIERRGHIFQINADVNGPYRICLDNTFSGISDKVVYLNLLVHEKSDSLSDRASPPLDSNTQKENDSNSISLMGASLHHISQTLRNVTIVQRHLVTRDSRHLETAESNEDRVFIWSLTETIIILTVCILQVYIVRSLFRGQRRSDGLKT